jgi:hypothetical protein
MGREKAAMGMHISPEAGHIPMNETATNGPRRDPHVAHDAHLPGPGPWLWRTEHIYIFFFPVYR